MFVNAQCIDCAERTYCKECHPGFYPIDTECYDCKDRFGPNCEECNSSGCTKCEIDYFLSLGKCESCLFIDGCKDDQCFDDGCRECKVGYYWNDGNCKPCSSAISGCVLCNSSDKCLKCASDFLTISDGICKCREGGKNQYTDELTGACECKEGYYMTEYGCQTCQYLIPGC